MWDDRSYFLSSCGILTNTASSCGILIHIPFFMWDARSYDLNKNVAFNNCAAFFYYCSHWYFEKCPNTLPTKSALMLSGCLWMTSGMSKYRIGRRAGSGSGNIKWEICLPITTMALTGLNCLFLNDWFHYATRLLRHLTLCAKGEKKNSDQTS